MSEQPSAANLALVLTGGGARAAYQVGCLKFIAKAFPEFKPRIITGVSAGAINAAHLASSERSFADAVDKLSQLWLKLTTEQVFRVDVRSLAGKVAGWSIRLVSGGSGPRMRGMVDTTPLRKFLSTHLPLDDDGFIRGVDQNIEYGRIDALAMTTTDYANGQSITWVQGRQSNLWQRPQRVARPARLSLEHVMASSALPLFFPAVRIDDTWHGDGGIRLTAPLSPALHLGASRILAVSPRFMREDGAPNRDRLQTYPSPARIAGVLMNAVFLDMLDHDVMQMNRINDLLRRLDPLQREMIGLRPVEVLILRPSKDLGRLAREYEIRLPSAFRFMERGLGTGDHRSADALSMVMFEHEYLARLVELGERDAEAKASTIEAFIGAE